MKTALRLAWRALAVFAVLLFVYQIWIFGHVVWWIWFNPSTSAFMEDRLEILQEKNPDAELRHRWVPYDRISRNLKRAIVAAEDGKFLDHDGFDWDALQKAYEKNLKKGKIVSGGSTISQQLAKNLFLSSKRTPWRKLQEAVITVMLETVMDKRRILEIYLNVIEWGNGVFGAEAAARYYYRTSAANLGPEQSARLAAMVPNPRFYDRHRSTPHLDRKTGIILARMSAADVP
ncbi:MAG: monofunctional biosynthetic peptidoglycan transglycosylase [Betaproteobacteria bacterium]|nr:monofunctional biosynthetic peptidoglycan transglycosylase [Betaproteobacteria bacterium]